MTTLQKPLSVLALLASLTAAASAQTYRAAAGAQLSQAQVHSADSPQLIEWHPSSPLVLRHSWATADRGDLAVFARAEHWDGASYQTLAMAYASFEDIEVVFSSAASGMASVGVNLTLEGAFDIVQAGSVYVGAVLNGQSLGYCTAKTSGITGAGHLAGYSMLGPLSFTHVISVPLNTPVTLHLRLDGSVSNGNQGDKTRGEYRLRLGGPTPPGPLYTPFDLPVGVSVDCPDLGIVANTWAEPVDMHLSVDDGNPNAGDSVRFTAWNQPAGQPVGMLYAWGVPTPPLAFSTRSFTGLVGSFDAKGWYKPATIASQPWMAGLELRARAVSAGPSGLLLSEPVQVQFQ